MSPRTRASRARLAAAPTVSAPSLGDVLAAFNDAVVVMDAETRIALFNPAAEEITGLPVRRVLGARCAEVFEETPLVAEMVARVQQFGQSESRSQEQLVRRRRSTPVRITCVPLWDKQDRVSGTALVIHDLGHQKMLEEAARRNQSLARLGTMVAGLAHEVRNPLAGIKGAAQLLAARLEDRAELTEYTAVISREVNRLTALVEDLLTLGAPPKPRLAALNIHRVIQHVGGVMSGELARAGVRLQYGFDPSLPDVLGDEAQLSQVLLNVVRNALDAMAPTGAAAPERSLLTISTRIETDFHLLRDAQTSGKLLRVEIADQGPGLDAETATQMFEPFFTTKARGTGLGLAISYKIIADHGGIIRATPNHPSGTVITVSLPVAPA
jgi:two-component system nitrogen regulation sensor histidine kinase GlnL